MKIYKYKDNVDTDVIIPARYLNSFDAKELASHAMVDIDPTFASTRKRRYHCSRSKLWLWFFKRTCTSLFKNCWG